MCFCCKPGGPRTHEVRKERARVFAEQPDHTGGYAFPFVRIVCK